MGTPASARRRARRGDSLASYTQISLSAQARRTVDPTDGKGGAAVVPGICGKLGMAGNAGTA
jgi:hypothetical protein